MNIKFNKYINKIGIEFEGFFSRVFLITDSLSLQVGTDGSLENTFSNSSPYEIRTPAMNEEQANKTIKYFAELFDEKIYRINKSCGLHYHISFNKAYYGHLMSYDFYKTYCAMFKEHFPKVYTNRKNNQYCREAFNGDNDSYSDKELPKYFQKKQSPNKYHFLNYQYSSYHTIEFRAYGGIHASVKGLTDCIQKTIDLVEAYIKNHKSMSMLKKKVQWELKKKKWELDIHAPKSYYDPGLWSSPLSSISVPEYRPISSSGYTTTTITSGDLTMASMTESLERARRGF